MLKCLEKNPEFIAIGKRTWPLSPKIAISMFFNKNNTSDFELPDVFSARTLDVLTKTAIETSYEFDNDFVWKQHVVCSYIFFLNLKKEQLDDSRLIVKLKRKLGFFLDIFNFSTLF